MTNTTDHNKVKGQLGLCAVCTDDHRPHIDCRYCVRYGRTCGRIHSVTVPAQGMVF